MDATTFRNTVLRPALAGLLSTFDNTDTSRPVLVITLDEAGVPVTAAWPASVP